MPIRRLLEGKGLAPREIDILSLAYDAALHRLHLVDRNDPVTEIVARKIIEVGSRAGDPAEIARLAIEAFDIKE